MKYWFICIVSLTCLSCGCNKNVSPAVELTDLILDKSYLSLTKGVQATLTPKLLPYSADRTEISWESSDPSVAAVADDGKVTAKAFGSATITVAAGSLKATCAVTVKPAIVGVYYFDGWAGNHRKVNTPDEPWTLNAPTHLTKRLAEDFSFRKPVWGWRDDSQEIMEHQIDLAADNGVDFFLYCWYWQKNQGALDKEAVAKDPKHTSLGLYLKAKNKKRLQYCLLIANHDGAEILGDENWIAAVEYWTQYFKDPQYMTIDGRPLVVLFGTEDHAINNVQIEKMQTAAVNAGFKKGLAIAGCYESAKKKLFTCSTHYNLTVGYSSGSEEKPFQVLIDYAKAHWKGSEQQPYIPVLNSGWDKRPWEGPDGRNAVEGWYFTGDTPELFKSFLGDAVSWMDQNPKQTTKERVVLIYAWNELGEGGYLVPTVGDPEAEKLKKIGELLKERSK